MPDFSLNIPIPHCRVLTGGLRTIGRCPCPRCLVPLDQTHRTGSVEDMQLRVTSARRDNQAHRQATEEARSKIRKDNYAINSRAVEKILFPKSLVPAYVRNTPPSHLAASHKARRTPFLRS